LRNQSRMDFRSYVYPSVASTGSDITQNVSGSTNSKPSLLDFQSSKPTAYAAGGGTGGGVRSRGQGPKVQRIKKKEGSALACGQAANARTHQQPLRFPGRRLRHPGSGLPSSWWAFFLSDGFLFSFQMRCSLYRKEIAEEIGPRNCCTFGTIRLQSGSEFSAVLRRLVLSPQHRGLSTQGLVCRSIRSMSNAESRHLPYSGF